MEAEMEIWKKGTFLFLRKRYLVLQEHLLYRQGNIVVGGEIWTI